MLLANVICNIRVWIQAVSMLLKNIVTRFPETIE